MRLTLRTMLAYLDDILEPNDSEDIGKKIDESEFATNLVHRTRDCMRRLRLGVPALFGRGLGADPNTVAEYLDNTLAGDRVPEFEKICLESDVHLAEVASCHQILTLVLGEPAEIDPDSRQRMYRLAAHADAPPVQSEARTLVSPPPVPVPVHPTTRRARPEVPEYLRESRTSWWPIAATIGAVAVTTCGLLLAFGPARLREQAVALVQRPATEPDRAASPPAPASNDIEPNFSPPVEPAGLTGVDDTAAANPFSGSTNPFSGSTNIDTPTAVAPDRTTPDSVADDAARERDPGVTAVPPVEPNDPAVVDGQPRTLFDPFAPPAPEPGGEVRRDLGADDRAASPTETVLSPMPDNQTDPAPIRLPPTRPTVSAPVAPVPDNQEPGGIRPETPGGLGRYTSSKPEVLLKYDAAARDWRRMPYNSVLSTGDRLMSLPLYQPQLSLSSGITIKADGAAVVELSGWTDAGAPIVSVEYGRLWLATVGKAGNAMQLQLGNKAVLVTFVDAESMLAIDVQRDLEPGKDPAAGATLVADLYVKSGLCRVRDAEAVQEVGTREHMSIVDGRGSLVESRLPEWMTTETLSTPEQNARTQLDVQLSGDRPVSGILSDLLMQKDGIARRAEVRSLAVRGLAHLGKFEPSIEALNDQTQRNYWGKEIEDLRMAVARSPQAAAAVRASLEAKRGGDAPVLYRMLWGYSGDDLRRGADRELVDALDHESLDVRVLAFWTLQYTTGLPPYNYQPAARDRKTAIRRWQQELDRKKIVPKSTSL